MQVADAEDKLPGWLYAGWRYFLLRWNLKVRILFCHTNYPAQFRRLAPTFSELGHEVVFLHKNVEWHATSCSSINRHKYSVSRFSSSEQGVLHPYLGRFEGSVSEGQGAAREALRIKDQGFYPDVIISHAGFGNGLYLKDVFQMHVGLDSLNGTTPQKLEAMFTFCIPCREMMSLLTRLCGFVLGMP